MCGLFEEVGGYVDSFIWPSARNSLARRGSIVLKVAKQRIPIINYAGDKFVHVLEQQGDEDLIQKARDTHRRLVWVNFAPSESRKVKNAPCFSLRFLGVFNFTMCLDKCIISFDTERVVSDIPDPVSPRRTWGNAEKGGRRVKFTQVERREKFPERCKETSELIEEEEKKGDNLRHPKWFPRHLAILV